MATKKKDEAENLELKREITCLHVTLGFLRGALVQMDNAVASKNKESFKDALGKFHAHLDRIK